MTSIRDTFLSQPNKFGLFLGTTAITGIAISCFSLAEPDKDVSPPVADTPQRVLIEGEEISNIALKDIIKLLSDESYKVRELAHKEIWSRGKKAIPALVVAEKSDDPELAERAAMILRNIRIGISADTPPHIAKMIERFQVDGLDEKEDILQDLYREKRYNQMLFMLAEMKNREQADRLHSRFQLLGYLAAKESLLKNNIEGALELLNMVPESHGILRSKAFVLARSGKLEAEIDKQKALNNKQGEQTWLTTLMLQQGDRAELKKYATKHKLENLLASLDLLDGEIDRFHTVVSKLALRPREELGLHLLKLVYEGDDERQINKLHKRFHQTAKVNKAGRDSSAIKTLYLTGANGLADDILKKFYWNKALVYYDNKEQPHDALASLKIKDRKSLEAWGARKRAKILALNLKKRRDGQNIGNFMDDMQILLAVAKLYHQRGAHEESSLLLEPLFESMYKNQKDRWFTSLSELIQHNMHELAVDIILTQADKGDIDKTIAKLYDDTQQINNVWDTLSKRKDKTVKQNFMDMAYLMGLLRSANSEADKLLEELIQIAKQGGAEELLKMNQSLYAVTDFKVDSYNGVKYIDYLLADAQKSGDKERIKAYTQDRLALATMNLNWQKMDEIISKDFKLIESSSKWLARYSVVLRKLGKPEKADKMLDRALLLTVGQENKLRDVANELSMSEDNSRAAKIYEDILLLNASDTSLHSLFYPLFRLSAGDGYYVKSGQWGKAASLAYALSALDMATAGGQQVDTRLISLAANSHFNIQFARGMVMSKAGNHKLSKKMLQKAHDTHKGSGILADYFYPAVKKAGYEAEYNLWVEESNQHLLKVIKDFPKAANTRNTLAWILAKAVHKLDEGIEHSTISLKFAPNEAAYLDTMGELWFAKGNRKKAVEWGESAVSHSKRGALLGLGGKIRTVTRTIHLMGQLNRFRTEPHPNK